MHGSLFALAMIAMTGATLAIVKNFGKRPDRRSILAGVVRFVLTFLILAYLAIGHLCSRGGPFGAIFFGAVAAGVVRASVEKAAARRWLWIGWFLLTFWGVSLCHMDGYIGNAQYGRTLANRPLERLGYVQDVLRKASDTQSNLPLPAGWIEESWRAAVGEDFPAPTRCQSGTLGLYWHTWFTGVFSLETCECGFWCLGGPLKSCSETIAIRPRNPEN